MIIEKLYIEQKTVQQVIRETHHSSKAIERYITSFKQVLMCLSKGMSREETAFAVKKSIRLVNQYVEIIDEYKSQGYILQDLMELEAEMETVVEFYEPYYR